MLRQRSAVLCDDSRRSGSLHVLIVLLLPVPFLLVAHQLYFWDLGPFTSPRWAVNVDRSYIEFYGYVQLLAAAVLLLTVGGVRRQGPVYLGWAATLMVIVLDDAFRWHERGGGWLVHHGVMPESLGLAEQDFGELAMWALLGLPVVLLLASTHRMSPARARRDSRWFVGLTALLMFFAVGVDMLLEVIQSLTGNTVIHLLVTFVEAGGEVGGMTALVAYAVHVFRRGPDPSERSAALEESAKTTERV